MFVSSDGDQKLGRAIPGGRRLLSLLPVKAEGDEGKSSPSAPPPGTSGGGSPAAGGGAAAAPAEAPAASTAASAGGGSIKEAISAFSKGELVAVGEEGCLLVPATEGGEPALAVGGKRTTT